LVCTLAALAAIGAALLLPRRTGAAFRHALLLAAVLRFALPTSWLAAAGARFAPRLHASPAVEEFGAFLLHPGAVALQPLSRAASHSPQPWLALWALGAAGCLALWAVRTLRGIPAVRPPNDLESDILAGIPLRIVACDHVPGACGWLRACVVLPDGLSDHLTPAELRAVAAHEMAHIRRRDNFWAAVVHGVVSVFWFHPLLWWMERRMLADRETACDEMVLRAGAEPEDYIAGLAKVCRMTFAGAAGYAGITGANLAARMEQIMKLPFHRDSSPFPRAATGAALAILMLLPLAAGLTRAQEAAPPDSDRELAIAVERYLASGHELEAITLLELHLAQNPADAELKLMLGNVLVRTGKYDRALAVLQELLKSRATADLYLRIGETYRRAGNDGAALAALRKAKEMAPENVAVVSTLALVQDHAGMHDQAAQSYRDVLILNPNNPVALNNYAFLLSESDLEAALSYAHRAVHLMPNEPNTQDTLGWVYLKRKQTVEAFASFRQAFEQKPADAAIRSHLAMAIEQKGDASKQAAELKLLLHQPDSPDNQRQIRALLQEIQ
jgi:Flp pilus assembly protein TadD/Zn-dependent protease with chaperone function